MLILTGEQKMEALFERRANIRKAKLLLAQGETDAFIAGETGLEISFIQEMNRGNVEWDNRIQYPIRKQLKRKPLI